MWMGFGVAMVVALGLVACGGQSGDESAEAEIESESTVELERPSDADLMAFKVGIHCRQQCLHAYPLVVEYQLFNGSQGIDHSAESHDIKESQIDGILYGTGVDILAVFHAEVMQHGEHGGGNVLRFQRVRHMLLNKGVPHDVLCLKGEGVPDNLAVPAFQVFDSRFGHG